MIEGIDLATLIAGLGFFLLGMERLEAAISALLGRRLRGLLRNSTRHPMQGIAVGTLATAILQSSSLVTLMLLAFVGAGVLTLANALGVILGANLGTTLTGWLVTAIGFKLDLSSAALPAIGIGAIGSVFLDSERRSAQLARLVLGLGLLLFGLDLMKASAAAFAAEFDPAALQEYSRFTYLLVGFGFTIVVQSSSAAMMVNLTALSTGVITLENAAALAIGADLGTTITVILGALKGSAAKRRVALAHFMFNVYSDTLAFILLGPLLAFVALVGIDDPLFSLVAFHSLFNLLGIIAFLPFLNHFGKWLEQRFETSDEQVATFLSPAALPLPDAALTALQRETAHLCFRVIHYRHRIAGLEGSAEPDGELWQALTQQADGPLPEIPRSSSLQYDELKELEGEILIFCRQLLKQSLEPDDAERFTALQGSARQAVHAAKAMKDIEHNIRAYAEHDAGIFGETLRDIDRNVVKLHRELAGIAASPRIEARMSGLAELARHNAGEYESAVQLIYRGDAELDDIELSTLLNVEREVYGSNAALLDALEDLLLPASDAARLEALKPA